VRGFNGGGTTIEEAHELQAVSLLATQLPSQAATNLTSQEVRQMAAPES